MNQTQYQAQLPRRRPIPLKQGLRRGSMTRALKFNVVADPFH